MAKKKTHAHRHTTEDGAVVCECGDQFKTDTDWRDHYEKKTTATEQKRLEERAT